MLAPRFMRTHARELQKKKRENKRQRTWVAREGNIIVAEQSWLAGVSMRALRPKKSHNMQLVDYVLTWLAIDLSLQVLVTSIDCMLPSQDVPSQEPVECGSRA